MLGEGEHVMKQFVKVFTLWLSSGKHSVTMSVSSNNIVKYEVICCDMV